MALVTWLDGVVRFESTVTGVYVAKHPHKAIVTSGSGGSFRNGFVCQSGGTAILRDTTVSHCRYDGCKVDADGSLLLTGCHVMQNTANGVVSTLGSTGTRMELHRCGVWNNGQNRQFAHGTYFQTNLATRFGQLDRCLVIGNTGWQVNPTSSGGTCGLTINRTLMSGGRNSLQWYSTFAGRQTTNRCTMVHGWSTPPGYQTAIGTTIVYNANDLRLRSPNSARKWAAGQVCEVGEICEDDVTSGSYFRTVAGGTTAGASRSADSGVTWAAFTGMPVDMRRWFWWPSVSSTVGAYSQGPDLNASLSMWPNGMFPRYVHRPEDAIVAWDTLPLMPEDTDYASTSCGEKYHRCRIDLKIDGVTGAQAANWNSGGEYASIALPPTTNAANNWGVQESWSMSFNHVEQGGLPAHTGGDSRITMAAVAASADRWNFTLTLEINGTEITWEALNLKVGRKGDALAGTFVPMVKKSAGQLLSGADFTNATIGFLSQVC